MNNNRWRQRGEFESHQRDTLGPISHHRKPPLHASWQLTVPSWEKQFCYSIGSVPWQKLLDTKQFMYLYDNVVQWNDSAGEEAFYNAKNRFWAKINGFPCDISLPDPDIYIDEIDWNSNVDQELLLDLERQPEYPDQENKGEEVVILSSSLVRNQSFSCTGWGDAEQDLRKDPDKELDRGSETCDVNVRNYKYPYESNCAEIRGPPENNRWGNSGDNSSRWKNNRTKQEVSYNGWKNPTNCRTGGDQGTREGNNRNLKGAHWSMSRYKTSRFHGEDDHVDRGWWRNGKGRKSVNFAY